MEDKNRLIPDIRPENIQTFTETSGGGQTATYKILEAHPILNGILDKLAFIRTHAAAVWYNKQDNETVNDKFDEVDESITQLNGKNLFMTTCQPKM